ncbi:MAG: hypothetical protein OHK0047_00740 [Leptolyngbyaceae cyanobacterium]|uniref:hypothetical protein n=1 Tax=Leptodesmis sichuanensis TaxID=2906798 RepID=UPI001F3F323F|nr:hypothetical protein [Leptodesmis sichuanensis]UIE36828.1 hypothetical protein KIK02_17635 [Leptodesmis sichuanensis A121]
MEHLPSTLTEQNKADLTRCAEDILLAREHEFPANLAEMQQPSSPSPFSQARRGI